MTLGVLVIVGVWVAVPVVVLVAVGGKVGKTVNVGLMRGDGVADGGINENVACGDVLTTGCETASLFSPGELDAARGGGVAEGCTVPFAVNV